MFKSVNNGMDHQVEMKGPDAQGSHGTSGLLAVRGPIGRERNIRMGIKARDYLFLVGVGAKKMHL